MLQPFREESLFLINFAVNDGTDSRSQLELETGSSESSPPSLSESSARHPPDSAASTTSEIFMSHMQNQHLIAYIHDYGTVIVDVF